VYELKRALQRRGDVELVPQRVAVEAAVLAPGADESRVCFLLGRVSLDAERVPVRRQVLQLVAHVVDAGLAAHKPLQVLQYDVPLFPVVRDP